MSPARKLFARTLETPGGLKIQTIHAFCERLLHLFPFGANVPARFEVPDEQGQAELLQRARREVLAEANSGSGTLGAAVQRLNEECGPDALKALSKKRCGVVPFRVRAGHMILRRFCAVPCLTEGRDRALH